MSSLDTYFTIPLALLHRCRSPLDVLETAVRYGYVSAGLGFRATHQETEFEALLEAALDEARERDLPVEPPEDRQFVDADGDPVPDDEVEELWEAAAVGMKLLRICCENFATGVACWLAHYREGEVFFRIKRAWLWNALYTARRDAGATVSQVFKPLSWREFRLLAAILSAGINKHEFTFCGWETLQARACGFHSKARFKAGRAALPAHCQPLSRQMIRDGTDKLEGLGFFARCRYSRGRVGGLMAYSFRHPDRADLIAAIQQWDASNQSFKTKTAGFRASDLAAFQKTPRRGAAFQQPLLPFPPAQPQLPPSPRPTPSPSGPPT